MAAPAWTHPGIHEQEQALVAEIAVHPDDAEKHASLGRVHAEKREWDAALEAYSRAARLGLDATRVSLLEGAVFLDAGWPLTARTRFDAILEREPGHGEARLGRARAWMKLEHPVEASADYEVAITALDPLQPGYVLEYRDALIAAGRKGGAVAALDAGIARLGPVPALEIAAVDLEVDAERYDHALRRLDRLLAASPGHPLWSARRGEILERAGRTEEARLAYADALENIQARTSRRRARRLDELETRVRAAMARNPPRQETPP